MSIFNADVLLNCTTEAKLATSIPPMPNGEWIFSITGVEFKNPKPDVIIMDAAVECIDPEVCAVTGMNPTRSKISCFCDVTDTGLLDDTEGKNIQLGKLREALGQNEAGVPWSPMMVVGGQVRGKTQQKPDSKDPSITRSEIVALSRL